MKKKILYLAMPVLFASLALASCGNQKGDIPPEEEKTTYNFEFVLDAPSAIKDDIKVVAPQNGEYEANESLSVTLSFEETTAFSFDGYFLNDTKVSEELTFTFNITEDTKLLAKFSETGQSEEPDPENPENPEEPSNPSFADVKVGEVYEEGKLGLWQKTNGEALYFDGAMDEKAKYYFGTTSDFDSAVDIRSTKVSETELTLEIISGTSAGQYIGATVSGSGEDSHNNIIMQDDEFRWTYNVEYDAYTAVLSNDEEVYIGSYDNYKTMSLSTMDHITGSDTNIAHVVQEEITNPSEENPEDPDPDTPVDENPSFEETQVGDVIETGKLGLWQKTNGEALYFDGAMDENATYYFGTTSDFDSAVDIKSTKVSETELTLEIISGTSAGQYIGATVSGSGEDSHNNIIMQDDEFRWTYNVEYDAYTAILSNDEEVYIGSYKTYKTMSLSNIDHITGSDTNIAHVVQNKIGNPSEDTDPVDPEPEPDPDPEEPSEPSGQKTNATYQHTFVKEDNFKKEGGTTANINGLTWTYTSASWYEFDGALGLHIGSNNTPQDEYWTISTNIPEGVYVLDFNIKIKGNANINGTYQVKIGGKEVLGSFTSNEPTSYIGLLDSTGKSLSVSLKADKGFYFSGFAFNFYVPDDVTFDVTTDEDYDPSNPDNPDVPGDDPVYSGEIPETNFEPITKEEYYKTIDFSNTSTLESSILELTNKNFHQQRYSDASYILQYTDEDLSDKGYLYGIYDGELLNPKWLGNSGDWNKEHIWPASRLPNYRDETKEGADLFNLRASNSSINSSRGNNYYSEPGEGGYYPIEGNKAGNDQRGDVARAIFYMGFKYESIGLEILENPNEDDRKDDQYYQMGILSTLIKWNKADPVDEFEMRRNSRIYEYQGNRNPFVDYPELVEQFF